MIQRLLGALAVLALSSHTLFAQVTGATITGQITDESGEGLVGVTIVATHTPSGSSYAAISRGDGRYTLANLRVGGPYSVSTTYTGYEGKKTEGLMLSIGQKLPLDVSLKSSSTTLGEVVVTATSDPVLNSERTGASTNISRQQIANLPIIVLSNLWSNEDILKTQALRVEDYMVKAYFTPDEILAKIKAFIRINTLRYLNDL